MSCTINNMGGAGSAVPKLRDEFTLTVEATSTSTIYTATTDCYVKLSVVGMPSGYVAGYGGKLLINGNESGWSFQPNSGANPQVGYFSGSIKGVAQHDSKTVSTVSTEGSSGGNTSLVLLLAPGDILSWGSGGDADKYKSIRVSVYY